MGDPIQKKANLRRNVAQSKIRQTLLYRKYSFFSIAGCIALLQILQAFIRMLYARLQKQQSDFAYLWVSLSFTRQEAVH